MQIIITTDVVRTFDNEGLQMQLPEVPVIHICVAVWIKAKSIQKATTKVRRSMNEWMDEDPIHFYRL